MVRSLLSCSALRVASFGKSHFVCSFFAKAVAKAATNGLLYNFHSFEGVKSRAYFPFLASA